MRKRMLNKQVMMRVKRERLTVSPAEFDSDPFTEISEEDLVKLSDEERLDYDKEKKKHDNIKAKEAREFASNMLIKLETILKSADESLQKTDEEVAVMDEDAKATYCKDRSKAVYESACANFDEIKINFGFVPKEDSVTEEEFVELSEEDFAALSEEEQEIYTAKKAAKDAEIQENTPTEGDDDVAEGEGPVSEVENAEQLNGDDENQGVDEKVGDDKEQQVDEVAEAVEVVQKLLLGKFNEESLYDEFSKIIPSPPEPPEFVLYTDPVENQILIKPNERKLDTII